MLNMDPVEFLGLQVCVCLEKPKSSSVLQVQNIPKDFETCKPEDIEVFLRHDMPIIGWDGNLHPNPKVKQMLLITYLQKQNNMVDIKVHLIQTIFVPQLLEDVPQITSGFSGLPGYMRHFDQMLGCGLTGE